MSAHAGMTGVGFDEVARPLGFETALGSSPLTFRGVLRNPNAQELLGGLHIAARIVLARASAFTAAGITPRQYDHILDPNEPGRVYVIEPESGWVYAGSSREWWRGVVAG